MSLHFIRVTHVEEERLDEELILLHPQTLQVKFLNETATVLWDALEAFPTVQDLTNLLAEARPELTHADSLAHVTAFLEDLAAAGLVERQEGAL